MNGHLDDFEASAQELADELIIEFKPVRLDGYFLDHLPRKRLVATFVIRRVKPIQGICQPNDDLVPDVVREERLTFRGEEVNPT